MDAWWWLLVVLAHVTQGSCDSEVTQGLPDAVVTLNTLRLVTQTPDKFLGISTSPRQLLKDGDYSVATLNMLQALSPGYLRVGGPESDDLVFTTMKNTSAAFLLTESQWVNLNQLAADTGLHLIFSLSPKSQGQSQLLSFSNDKGYDITWQLGYCTTKSNGTTETSSKESGKEVSNLRRLIDSFTRYQNTAVLSPDMELCVDFKCLEAHKDFFRQSNDAIDVVVLQMKPQEDLKGIKNMFENLDQLSSEIAKYSFNRDIVLRQTKNTLKKNFWIAGAETTHHSGGLREAMSCALSLGLTSRLGYHTFLIQLHQMSQPSPSYWTALLWRALVGRDVLGARVWPLESELSVFAACTEANPQPAFDTEWEYDAGAVTVWGVNAANHSTHVSLRTGLRFDHVHIYTLTADDHNSGNIRLNGRPLRMVHGVLPRLSPRIRTMSRSMSVTVPPQSVFFIVLPDAQAPACQINAGEKLADNLKKEEGSPLVMKIPILTLNSPSLPEKLGMKSDDIFLEKGGIFADSNGNKNESVNGSRTEADKDTQESTKTGSNGGEQYIEKKTEEGEKSMSKNEVFINSVDFPGDSLKCSNKNCTGSESSKKLEDHFSVAKDKEYNFSLGISINRNESNQPSYGSSVTSDDNATKVIKLLETEIPRVKRSEDDDYYEPTQFRDTETSPLYRRVNMLRRILNKMQQSAHYEIEEANQHLQGFTGTIEALQSKNKKHLSKIGKTPDYPTVSGDYPVEISSRRTNFIEKERIPRVQNKNVENINYLPGEFYEILGGLKIDSNVSLKDKEEIMEANDSLLKEPEPQKCNESDSKLRVTKKPDNDPQEDRRLVEQATENSRQYYMLKNNTPDHIKTEKVAYKRERLNQEDDKLAQTFSNEDLSGNNEQAKVQPSKFFRGLKNEEIDHESVKTKLPVKRTKREINSLEEGNLNESLPSKNEENYNKPDYSDEVQLRRFLQELTSEGEQLLQTIDEEYESNMKNSSYELDTEQFLTTKHVAGLDKDQKLFIDEKFLAENKTEEPDFYLKNNIVIDKEKKPKRKYPSLDELTVDYTFLDKTTDSIKNDNLQKMKTQLNTTIGPVVGPGTSQTDSFSSNEPSMPTELITSGDFNYTYENTLHKNITDAISNADMFLESIPETDKTTKSGIDPTINGKQEPSNSFLYNYIENTNTERITKNFSKVAEVSKEITEVSKEIKGNNSTGNKTDKHKVRPDGEGEPTFTKNIGPATGSGQNSDEEKLLDINSALLSPNNISKNIFEEIKKVEDNSFKITDQQQAKPGAISESKTTLNSSDSINVTTENSSDKRRKIHSESKLESKIVLPPPKPTLTLRPLLVPSVLTLTPNSSLPNKIDLINNKIIEFNNKHKLSVPVVGTSLAMNTTFSDKYKERLELIKQRLQKARERLLNVTSSKTPQLVLPYKPLIMKREIIMNRGLLNSLINREKENKAETQSQENQFDSTMSKQLKGPLINYPSSENLYLLHRLKRQVYDDNERESSLSMEHNPDQSRNIKNEDDTKRQPLPNILTPYYFSAIKKWVIPLSNRTENMLYNDRLFPVNLYGIVSDKWIQERKQERMGVERSSETEVKRHRRSLQYPCVQDKFNDFEAEDESSRFPSSSNVENGKIASARSIKGHSLTDLGPTLPGIILPQIYSRSKRAITHDIERNEMEMKALLTNEIVKDKPTNYEPDHENVFSSMLHKTMSKTVTNKTGIERMFELAKQYKETNPSSLEIFSNKNNRKPKSRESSMKNYDKSDEENAAIELNDDGNIDDGSTPIMKNQTDITEIISRNNFKDKGVQNSSIVENGSTEKELNNDNIKEDMETPEDAWSDFLHEIKELFNSVTTVVKKGIV